MYVAVRWECMGGLLATRRPPEQVDCILRGRCVCVVDVRPQRAKLLDLNSLNGVFRNGVKIIGGSEDLASGDSIRFGYDPAEFTYVSRVVDQM
jgi:hypothetical protein